MAADVEKLRAAGNDAAAQRKAEVALLLADQLDAWAEINDAAATGMDRRELRVQLAEANLQAGKYERARGLFGECAAGKDETALPTNETDLRVVFGQAESMYRLGQFAEALPKFNRLATHLPPAHPTRWKSLLRDLQCRTALSEPPAGIIKVIEQQKYLYPDLGGAASAVEFERLRRENERRLNPG
jgi:tetratricopeptide (TPR) repeat protein